MNFFPLLLVFLSGLGFSVQSLIIKLLADNGYHGSVQCVFSRGIMQIILTGFFIHLKDPSVLASPTKLFGDQRYVQGVIVLRSIVGYFSIALAFLAVERLPVGDSSTLIMLSPFFASIIAIFALKEPWRKVEVFSTALALFGAVLVSKPATIFNSSSSKALDTIGVCLGILSAFFAGCAFITVRLLGTVAKMPWLNVCFVQGLGQLILSIPHFFLSSERLQLSLSSYQVALIIAAGVIGSVSQAAMTIGMQREKSATATAMRMSDVVFSFIWQSYFTPDVIDTLSIIGAVLVNISILIMIVFKKEEPEITNAPSPENNISDKWDDQSLLAVDEAVEIPLNIDSLDLDSREKSKIDVEMYLFWQSKSKQLPSFTERSTSYTAQGSSGYVRINQSES